MPLGAEAQEPPWEEAPRLPIPRWRLAEVVGLILCLLLVSGGLFVANTRTGAMAPYPLFPFLIWAVLRFQMRGTTVVTLFFASLILLGAARGQGVFVASTTSLLAAILSAQQYLA
ncbi:MAG: MASE1 domain-containing protein, partial [Chloroflexales bacterium]